MPDVRPLNEDKYKISKHKFLEVYHFCLQYHEWLDELEKGVTTKGTGNMDGMPKGKGETSSSTEALAIRRHELKRKCELVEQTAIEADPDLYPWILKAVTNEGASYKWLKTRLHIPCSRNTYYERRRKFYWLLSKKI